MSDAITFQEGTLGVTEPAGFVAAACSADVRNKRNDRLDVGILYSHSPCVGAGVFTKNAVKAAPVLDCERILSLGGPLHGVIANSGNANACTGTQGREDSLVMIRTAEKACQAPTDSFFVCSTGRIGDLLPMDRLQPAIAALGESILAGANAGKDFAQSILTSDTKIKTCSATFEIDGKTVTVGGAAKGAGMIQPNMATMLGFITTDIDAERDALQASLVKAVATTFNAITVDGDMSTNDTVLLLANGASGVALDSRSVDLFESALEQVCDCLADKIVADGERITKVVELLIEGAGNTMEAEAIARSIGNSLLVKTSWFGNDPNWGRLMDALGYAPARIDPDVIDISYNDTPALVSGDPVPGNKPKWKEIVSQPRFSIRIDLHQGEGFFRLRATDLTEGYVNFNKSE